MIKKIQNGHKVNLFWVTISYGYLQTHHISLIIKLPLAVTSHLSAFNRALCASNIFSDHLYRWPDLRPLKRVYATHIGYVIYHTGFGLQILTAKSSNFVDSKTGTFSDVTASGSLITFIYRLSIHFIYHMNGNFRIIPLLDFGAPKSA